MTQRLAELSLLESALYHESRLVPPTPQFVFQSAPTSLSDPPAALSPSTPDNMRFLAYRAFLKSKRHMLLLLSPLEHRDADRRRGKLLEKITTELESLASLENNAWERQKLLSGLYGLPDEASVQTAKVYRTGMSPYMQGVWYN